MTYQLKIIKLGILFALLSNPVSAEQVRLEKSTLGEFARVVSDYLDKPVIISQDLNRPFSINAKFDTKEQLKQLFKTSILSAGLSYDESDLAIVVAAVHNSQSLPPPVLPSSLPTMANSFIQKPLSVVVYPLYHLPSSDVYLLLSKNATSANQFSVIDSVFNNSLVISATDIEHKNLKKIISVLDSPPRQVLIEAVISDLSDKDYQGLDTKLENFARLNTALDAAQVDLVNPLAAFADFGMKLITSKSLRFFLDWIQTSDSSSVLSKPKILTLDRKQASIVVGQNVPFITGKSTSPASSTATPFQTIDRQDVGLKLNVTPVILPNGLIELSIVQESSAVDADTAAADIVTSKRSISSTALLKDGDTVLLGGLSSVNYSAGHTSTMPFTGIPIFDWFFSGNTNKQTNTNLVVLISAKVVSGGGVSNPLQGGAEMPPPELLDVPVTRLK